MAALPLPSFASQTMLHLKAEAVTQQILPPGDGTTSMLGFNGSMPGPELRLRRGQQVQIDVENGLDEGTAVHWHGIRLENQMDGVPMLTQDLIEPADTKAYSFVPPDSGTYWYHSHYTAHEQVARGLMGALIIEDDMPPDVDHDITVLISDWLMQKDGTLTDQFTDMHSLAHGGFMGNYARAFLSQQHVKQGDRVRFRLINAATNRVFSTVVSGVDGSVVALDGMALAEPLALTELILAPAQRVDLIVDIIGPVGFDMVTQQGHYRLADLAVRGTNTDRETGSIPALAPPNLTLPGIPTQNLTLRMMGGAMAGRHEGDNIWAFNNISNVQSEPFGSFKNGETVQITLANETSFAHGVHLHGHHFYEVDEEGLLGNLRDTTLINSGESRDIICVFDNPGRWLLHCHMLSHAFGGMRTWVDVA